MSTGAADGGVEMELDEPGFRGTVRISGDAGARQVTVSGTRADAAESEVAKELPADRDPALSTLVERVVAGDRAAAAELLAHVGVLDPGAPPGS